MQHGDRPELTDCLTVILRMMSQDLTWLLVPEAASTVTPEDWRTVANCWSGSPCSCAIGSVYNQDAYAHNIFVNWVFTLLDYLTIKNTHLLFMATLPCSSSVGYLCVLVFTVHGRAVIPSALSHHHWLQSDSGWRKLSHHSHRITFKLWGTEGKTGCFNHAKLQSPCLWQPCKHWLLLCIQ